MAAAGPFVDPADDDSGSSASSGAALTVHGTMHHLIANFGYPAIRLFIAFGVVWMASSVSSKRRLYSGFVFAGLAGFLKCTFLRSLPWYLFTF